MAKIKTEKGYNVVMERIEELLGIENNETSIDSKYSIKLELLSSLVEEFEPANRTASTRSSGRCMPGEITVKLPSGVQVGLSVMVT